MNSAKQWEDLFAKWLAGELSEAQDLPPFSIATRPLSQKNFYWPLAGIFLGRANRKHSFPSEILRPVFAGLSAKILTLIDARFEESSGLVYIEHAWESPLTEADFWPQGSTKIADPGFLALLVHALENLIQIGGQVEQDVQELSTYYELLTFSINDTLWNDEYGMYFPFDLDAHQMIVSDSIGGLLFWLADVPDQDQAEAMYQTLANNFVHPKHYYFPTSCVLDGRESAQVDLLINYLLYFGLIRFEFGPTAKALRLHTQYLVEEYHCQPTFNSSRFPKKPAETKPSTTTFHSVLWEDFSQVSPIHYSNQD